MARGIPIHKLALTDQPLRASAPVLTVRWNELIAWAEPMRDPENVSDLHDMRIAAKRLRYTLEIFAPVLPESSADVLRTVAEIQERIGAIHDCDVLFPLLHDTVAREMKRERKKLGRQDASSGPPPFLAAEGLVALMSRKRAERQARFDDFLTWWDTLPPAALGESIEKLLETAPETVEHTSGS